MTGEQMTEAMRAKFEASNEIAIVRSNSGRLGLWVLGTAVAMEGDPCRDADLMKTYNWSDWTEPALRAMADKINAKLQAATTARDEAWRVAIEVICRRSYSWGPGGNGTYNTDDGPYMRDDLRKLISTGPRAEGGG